MSLCLFNLYAEYIMRNAGLEEAQAGIKIAGRYKTVFGEGNGSPLQCSCLENPRDGEAWWAAIYGVAQSQTRLKHLSSSSSIRQCWGPAPVDPGKFEGETALVNWIQ